MSKTLIGRVGARGLLAIVVGVGAVASTSCTELVGFEPIDEAGDVLCADGVDNDGDGQTDCEDAACAALPTCDAAPVAVDDEVEASEDTALVLEGAALTANDTDEEGAPLAVTAVANPVQGTVSLEGATIRFLPAADFVGDASFEYTVSDGAFTDVGLVTVVVTSNPDAPVAVDDTLLLDEDTPTSLPAAFFLANDTDSDGDDLALASVQNPVGGTVALDAGVVTFTPAADFFGAASFDYNVTDGDGGDVGSVAITVAPVNDGPAFASAAPSSATEDLLLAYLPQLTDVDGPDATWTFLAADTCSTLAGATLDANTGAYAFTAVGPQPIASCTLAISVCDGGTPDLCASQTRVIDITPVNDAPTITSSAATSATEDLEFTYAPTGADGDGPDAHWAASPADTCGGAVDGDTGAYAFTPAGPTPPASCDLGLQLCDGGDPNECAFELTTISITPVNDAPVITNAPADPATEDLAFRFDADVLDPDGATPTWALLPADTCSTAVGATLDSVTGEYAFTPAGPTPPGACTLAISVCDGDLCDDLSASITIIPVNDAPSFTSDPPTGATEDVEFAYAATAVDPEGATGSWAVLPADTCGASISPAGLYTFTPVGPEPAASCDLAIQFCDGGAPDACVTQSTTISITAVNDAPVIATSPPSPATEDTLFSYDADRSDPDGPARTWSVLPADTCGGIIDALSGVYEFVPEGPTPPAACTLAISVCDGGNPDLCDDQVASIAITAVNDAPAITSTPGTTATEDVAFAYAATGTDADGPDAVWSVLPADTCGGTINAASGAYAFTPAGPTPPASCTLAISLCDDGSPELCATQTETITIASVNTGPSIVGAPATSATEDVLYAFSPSVTDLDGPDATWSLDPTHTCGGAIDPDTGAFTFTPPGPLPPASCVLAISVCDGGSPELCDSTSATISITAVNATPAISTSAPAAATEDVLVTYNAGVDDNDGPTATWSLLGTHTCGGSINSSSGVLSFTPAGPTPAASCTMAIRVCDGGVPNRCATQSQLVAITAVNDAPSITSSNPVTATEDTLHTYNAAMSDPDGSGATWSVLAATDTCDGSINATGKYTFTPVGPVVPATCVRAIQVCDAGGLCGTQTSTITITAVNDFPVYTSTPPDPIVEDSAYVYAAAIDDPDGLTPSWSKNNDTCGGAIDSVTGVYTLSLSGPVPPASCNVGVRVCDNGSPSRCVNQTTTVSITPTNDAPTITSSPGATATEDVSFTYNPAASDPDGSGLSWSHLATHTCGGTINGSTGAISFKLDGPVPPASCVLALQVCDGAGLCAQQTATITSIGTNDAPTINSTAGTSATEGVAYSYNATRLDPDGPSASWSLLGTHTCGGSINSSTGAFTFTPAAPTPPSSCLVSIQVCDLGSPSLCAAQSTTVNITQVNSAPSISTSIPTSATDGEAYSYDANSTDVDGPGATWSLHTGDTCAGSINSSTGVYAFTPNAAGTCTVSLKVCDGGVPNLCANQSALVTIAPNDWTLVYDLTIPATVSWNPATAPTYAIDNSASVGTFSKVRYRLDLDAQWVTVDMDAFTAQANRLGVPHNWNFEVNVTNVAVQTNVAGVTPVTGAAGNIEFWPNCYDTAANGVFDYDDAINPSPACQGYGSMQVHIAPNTIFAMNRWGQVGGGMEVGIGNATSGTQPDWTFTANGASYGARRLRVYVLEDVVPAVVSCADALADNPAAPSGVYSLDPDGAGGVPAFDAYCDMTTDGGGWAKILQYTTAPFTDSVNAIGNVAVPTNTGAAKLSDAQINALIDLTGVGEYRMKSQQSNNWVYLKSDGAFVDNEVGWGFTRSNMHNVEACEATSYAGCAYATANPVGWLDTLHYGLAGDTCDRYFIDHAASPQCFNNGGYPNRCVSGGTSCGGYAPMTNYTLWLRPEPGAATCAEILLANPAATDGVYALDPDGLGGNAPFDAYCDMTDDGDGGGWTLVGRWGAGAWPELTQAQYVDLFANPTSDVGGADLLDPSVPAAKTVAWFDRAKTNALYHSSPYGANSAVRVEYLSTNDPGSNGTYYQQRYVVDGAWDFWAAIRNMQAWSAGPDPDGTWVAAFGTDFGLARSQSDYNELTNVVTHNTLGDTLCGHWGTTTHTLNDASVLTVSRHGGLLCDGYGGEEWMWWATLMPADARFKNDTGGNRSVVWLR